MYIARFIACIAFGLAAFSAIDANALALTGVKSRKVHGPAGPFDLTIDTTQAFGAAVTVEPRAIGSGHVIVFQFDSTITTIGVPDSRDGFGTVGLASAAITGASSNEVSVTITGIPDNKRMTISLAQVNGGLDLFAASMGFLVGDVNNSRTVNSSDISSLKALSGQATAGTSFLFDVNASGAINSSDISFIKARSGLTLSLPTEVSLILSKSGLGLGNITSMPAGINCGSACAANFTQTGLVTLTAAASVASTFTGWSGGCTGVSPTAVIVLATSLNCTATFTAIPMIAGLSWDALTSANLSGYRVYYGTVPGSYAQPAGQGIDVGNIANYAVTGLNSGARYYFAVTAYDASGVESPYSNEVSKVVP